MLATIVHSPGASNSFTLSRIVINTDIVNTSVR
jgi:hypothetical protein